MFEKLKKYDQSIFSHLGDNIEENRIKENFKAEALNEYLDFLVNYGYGMIGEQWFEIFDYPKFPEEIFDKETAIKLKKYILLGTDHSGFFYVYNSESLKFDVIDSASLRKVKEFGTFEDMIVRDINNMIN